MKIALVCKSDSTGGAAVVTFRLMEALRRAGHDARMIVAEKRSDSEWVIPAAPAWRMKLSFLAERLSIFLKNGRSRRTLFQIDTGACGLPVYKIPFIREADVVALNWVNQGMLSLKGIEKIAALGKPIVWTMHDMWNMTGICHHAGSCRRFLAPTGKCGDCPLLASVASDSDLSRKTWLNKQSLYRRAGIRFVAVSSWLAGRAEASTLMRDADVYVIPNAFPISGTDIKLHKNTDQKIRIIFGAARIDDPVKGHQVLVEATRILADEYPDRASDFELITFGTLKNPEALSNVAISHRHLGRVSPAELRKIYESGDIVVSTSEWETLPGTLIEGQAWGCVPVALNHGGQSDIISHLHTGWLASWHTNPHQRAHAIAEGIIWAAENRLRILPAMQKSVMDKFSESSVADAYIRLFNQLIQVSQAQLEGYKVIRL